MAQGNFYGQQRLERWLSDSQTDSDPHTSYPGSLWRTSNRFNRRPPPPMTKPFLILTEETPVDASADSATSRPCRTGPGNQRPSLRLLRPRLGTPHNPVGSTLVSLNQAKVPGSLA